MAPRVGGGQHGASPGVSAHAVRPERRARGSRAASRSGRRRARQKADSFGSLSDMAPRWHERVYRAILRLFPSEFRDEFGESMSGDFRDQYTVARERRAASVVRLWLHTLGGVVR